MIHMATKTVLIPDTNGTTPSTRRKTAATMTAESGAPPRIQLAPISQRRIVVPIVGTAPLIVHAWSEKARKQMLDAQQSVKRAKANRDPEADFRESLYYVADSEGGGYGFPAIAFKAAAVGAARLFDRTIKMTELRQFLGIGGVLSADGNQLLVKLDDLGSEPCVPVMREDMVRVGMGTDLRFRGMFLTWRTELHMTFIENSISLESVLGLVNAGGMTVGVGEWRPERNGMFGTFTVDENKEVQVLK
jgi:hypothetical protein